MGLVVEIGWVFKFIGWGGGLIWFWKVKGVVGVVLLFSGILDCWIKFCWVSNLFWIWKGWIGGFGFGIIVLIWVVVGMVVILIFLNFILFFLVLFVGCFFIDGWRVFFWSLVVVVLVLWIFWVVGVLEFLIGGVEIGFMGWCLLKLCEGLKFVL